MRRFQYSTRNLKLKSPIHRRFADKKGRRMEKGRVKDGKRTKSYTYRGDESFTWAPNDDYQKKSTDIVHSHLITVSLQSIWLQLTSSLISVFVKMHWATALLYARTIQASKCVIIALKAFKRNFTCVNLLPQGTLFAVKFVTNWRFRIIIIFRCATWMRSQLLWKNSLNGWRLYVASLPHSVIHCCGRIGELQEEKNRRSGQDPRTFERFDI